MGIIIFIILFALFIYGIILINKKDLSIIPSIVAMFLMMFQLFSILGNPSLSYEGLSVDEFSSETAFYIAFALYYIGYFIWSIIALLLVYIPIIFSKSK